MISEESLGLNCSRKLYSVGVEVCEVNFCKFYFAALRVCQLYKMNEKLFKALVMAKEIVLKVYVFSIYEIEIC